VDEFDWRNGKRTVPKLEPPLLRTAYRAAAPAMTFGSFGARVSPKALPSTRQSTPKQPQDDAEEGDEENEDGDVCRPHDDGATDEEAQTDKGSTSPHKRIGL